MKGIINVRSLSKRLYRRLHDAAWHHNDKIWPYVKIKRDAQNRLCEVVCAGKLVRQASLKQLQTQRQTDLVIVASGPSAQHVDFSRLAHADVLMVNGAVNLLAAQPSLHCHYYMVIDQGFVQDQIQLMQPILQRPEVVFVTTVFCLNKIYELLGRDGIQAQIVVLEERQKPIFQAKPAAQDLQQESIMHPEQLRWQSDNRVGFGLDIQRGFVGGGTVVYPALQWAAALGYERVFLVGVDMTRFNQPRFYETQDNYLPSKLDVDFKTVIEPSFTLAAEMFKQLNIQCLNLCVDSGLGDEIFQRVDLSHWLHSSNPKPTLATAL